MAAEASPMGPPMLPGYSLRVQLFSHSAHALGDKPIRCFRVVTSPEITVRGFCQEASRIHEINYGEPLAIKKVQDDQEFDITQNEILGSLFTTMSTIRVVQAPANPGVRDSLPPTSALRFDPRVNPLKRGRESSVGANGYPSSRKPEKRQKVLDPDKPLPSREEIPAHLNGYQQEPTIPNSQESIVLSTEARFVRLPRIPETPEPPSLRNPSTFESTTADRRSQKAANQNHHASPRETSAREPSHLSNGRAKSASYHIPRTTERGTSVSTAATSPQSADSQRATQNGVTPTPKRKSPSGGTHKAMDEDSIYDVVSDEEPMPKPKRLSLKARDSPTGLPGLEWAKNRNSNTPPNGTRRSISRDQAITPNSLPLTPNSKEREQKKHQQSDAAKKARIAAAEAAEQRKREADEARLADETRVAKEARAKREEHERLEVEEFNKAEAERKTKAERMEKDRKAQEEKDARLARLAEANRVAQVEQERRRKETLAAMKAAEGGRRQEEDRAAHQGAAENAWKFKSRSQEVESPLPEAIRPSKSSAPILPKPRALSSTPFIPHGRATPQKSCLKSSEAIKSSSPVLPFSSGSNGGVEITDTMPILPQPRARTVSFDLTTETLVQPTSATRILPPRSAAKGKTPVVPPAKAQPKSLPAKATAKPRISAILPPPRTITPIPPPGSVKMPSNERSASPVVRATPVPPPAVSIKRASRERSASPVVKATPIHPPRIIPNTTNKMIPAAKIAPPVKATVAKSPSPVEPPSTNGKSKPVKEEQAPVEESYESEDDEEQDEEEEESDVEMADVPEPAGTLIEDASESEGEAEGENGASDIEMANTPALNTSPKPAPSRENRPSQAIEDADDVPSVDSADDNADKEKEVAPKAFLANPFAVKSEPVVEAEPAEESGEEDLDATRSHRSSSRDSRSPVIFHQHTSKAMAARLRRIPRLDATEKLKPLLVKEESDDEPTPNSKPASIIEEIVISSDSSSSSDPDSEVETGGGVQFPKSSPPIQNLPAHLSPARPSPRQSPARNNTQSQVNNQISSSLSRMNSTPIPAPTSSAVARPAMKFGASLSSLSAQRNLTASRPKPSPKPVNGIRKSHADDSSESEDDESSSSDSESEEEMQLSLPSHTSKPSTPRPKPTKGSDDETDSNSDSDSDAEDKRIQNELKIKIAGVRSSNGSVRSKAVKAGTASASKADQAKRERDKKYLTGYSFSQPP